MELKEFLEKFLPDYEVKRKPIENEVNKSFKNSGINPAFKERHITDAMLPYFPDALQNFADELCAKQREECVNTAEANLEEVDREPEESIKLACGWCDLPSCTGCKIKNEHIFACIDDDSIRHTPQPKIDKL